MTLSAVIDANVVIGLSKGNVFSLLPELFQPLFVAKSVEYEVIQFGRGRAGCAELQQALADGWIVSISLPIQARTPHADRELVEVARLCTVDLILTGDVEVAKMAEEADLKHLSAPEIVAILKMAGRVPSAASIFDTMSRSGFGIDPADRQTILRLVGEE